MDATIVSALIGGLIALCVVGVTARIAVWQLKHDREQRATDRALQAKRDLLVDALKAAIVLIGSAPELSRKEVDVGEVSTRFTDALARMNAAGAVASLEVMARGRDFVNVVAKAFTRAMTERTLIGPEADHHALMQLGMEIVQSQRAFRGPYQRLVAAIRRDLGIVGASDDEVSAALNVDADEVEEHVRDMYRRLGQ